MKTFRVETQTPERLDQYLSRLFDSVSRSHLAKMIKREEILVNGNFATPKLLVENGMEITILTDPEALPEEGVAPPLPEILYEDADVLVLNKPAGLNVHRANAGDMKPTLVQSLLLAHPEVATVGDDPDTRPGIVHRLDKDASGVMVIAKNQEAFLHLKEQFKTRAVKKIYTVLVYGNVSHDHDTVHLRIDRSKRKGTMIAHPETSDFGREAMTEYDVLQRYATTTLLRVRIHTGRTHQIRVHFFSMDHPVVGDKLYKKRTMRHINPIPLPRLFLHASEMTITLPSGEEKTFVAPLPDELESILASLPNS